MQSMAFMLTHLCAALGAKKRSGSAMEMDDFLPAEFRTKPKPTLSDVFSYLKARALQHQNPIRN